MIFTVTAEPSAEPPRIRLDLDTGDTDAAFTSITIRRDGVVIRATPPVGSDVSVVYDYDAPYDVAVTYTVEAQIVTSTAAWTETWSSLASWTSVVAGWSVASGKATSSTVDANITRTVSGTLGSLSFADVDFTTVQILDSTDVLIVEIEVLGDRLTLTGNDDPVTSAGSGAFSLVLSNGMAHLSGAAYESVSVATEGVPSKVGLLAAPGDPAELLAFDTTFAPTDVAVDASGFIWAADFYGDQIHKFDSTGALVASYGSSGTGNGQFNGPGAIAIDSSGNPWVTDYGNNRVQKFNSSGVYQSQFGSAGTGNGQFAGPGGLCFDSGGFLWVIDYGNHRVQKFNSSGTYQSQFGSFGTGNGQFGWPWGITRDSSNNLYTTEYGAGAEPTPGARVQKFNSSGVYQTQWAGAGEDGFVNPLGIEADSANNIHVANTDNPRVQKFTSVGAFLYEWSGGTDGAFANPWALTVNSSDKVYVADTNNNRIVKFESTQQAAVVDDVTATLAPPTPVTVAGSGSDTLDGSAAWLIHATTPGLSVKFDNGPTGSPDNIYATEETSRIFASRANGRSVLEIEGSAIPVVVNTSPRRTPDRTLQLFVKSFAARDSVLAATDSNDPVLLRSPASWDVDMPEGWFSVGDIDPVERFNAPLLGQQTTLTLPLTPVRTPVIETEFGRSYADDVVAGGTYGDAVNSGRTYLERLTG